MKFFARCRNDAHAFMRIICICLVATMWLYLSSGDIFALELSSANAALNELKKDLSSGSIVRVHILFMPYDMESYSAVRPDMLERYARTKINFELSPTLIKELVRSIDRTVLYKTEYEPDLRWGLIFFDNTERPVHSIYLNGRYQLRTGRMGYIDGVPVGLNRFLIYWLESNFLKR